MKQSIFQKSSSILLCICMLMTLLMSVPVAAETDSVSYTAYPQGMLQNVAAGKYVRVTSLGTADFTNRIMTDGKNLTDERQETYWESKPGIGVRNDVFKNPEMGAFAIVNLGASYPIYRIEVVGEKEALKDYHVYGIKGTEWYAQGTLLMWNTSSGSNVTVRNTAQSTRFLPDAGNDQKELSVNFIDLYGEEFQTIRIHKTTGDAAKFAELRVYSIEPKLVEVTPRTADKLWCSDTVDASLPLTKAVDNDPDTIAHPKNQKNNDPLRLNFDLGDKYYVRRIEYWPRASIATVDDPSKKKFEIWTGNADNIETNITTSGGTNFVSFNQSQDLTQGAISGAAYTYAHGGATFCAEKVPTEATQYVTFQWNTYGGHTMAEFKVFAEDRTAKNVELVNVADFASKKVLSNGMIQLDLGAYYNVKKLVANGNTGAFRIVGTSTTTLGYDEALLAATPSGITKQTDFDVKLQNVVRYITFKPKDAASVLSDLKVYAVMGQLYTNISEGKTAKAIQGGSNLVNGMVEANNGFAWGIHASSVNTTATPSNTMNIDLGVYKTIDAVSITFRNDNEVNAWERNTFQLWGANQDDFSDKEIIASQGARTAPNSNVWTFIADNPKPYRYLVVTTYSNGKPQKLNDYLHYLSASAGYPIAYRDNTTYYLNGTIAEVKNEKVWTEIQVYSQKEQDITDAISVSGLQIVNEKGYRIPDIFSKSVTPYATVTVKKLGTGDSNPVNLLLAEYDASGKLMGVNMKTIPTAHLTQFENVTPAISLDLTGDSGTVKAFAISNDMMPLSKTVSYGGQEIFPSDILEKPVTWQLATETKDSSGNYYSEYGEHNNQYDIDAIFYDGTVYKGKQTKIFAYLGIPKTATAENPVPAMVLVHGGGCNADKAWVKKWNDAGYAAISMNLYHEGPDGQTKHPYAGAAPFDYTAFLADYQNAGMYHCVTAAINAQTLLRGLDKVDADKIGLTGFSWGGVVTTITAGVDNRFQFAVPVYGGGYLDYSRTYFKDYYPRSDASAKWDPANFVAAAQMPVLYVNDDSDAHFSLNTTTMSYDVTPEAYLCIKHNYGHGPGGGQDVPEAFALADAIFSGKEAPFIKIDEAKAEDGSFTVTYTAPEGISVQSVSTYYITTEELASGGGSAIGWQNVASYTDSGNTISVTLPQTAKQVYASLKDSDGHIISTPLVAVK